MIKDKSLIPTRRFARFKQKKDWEIATLRELSNLITKGTTPLDKSGVGSVNFVKIENISVLSGDISNTQKITLEEHNKYLKRSQLEENDILFSIAGTLGRTAVINKEILPANTNQALAIIRLAEGDLSFITTYLKGRAVLEYIKKNPTIGAQPNLSLKQVGDLKMFIPSFEEQTYIGELFKTMDNLINLQQQKITKLKDLKSGYLNDMFPKEGQSVPKLRFVGFKEQWKELKLSQLGDIITGSTPSTQKPEYYAIDGIPWVTPTDISSNITYRSARHISKEGQKVANIVPKDTILVTCIASIGKNTIIGTEGSFNQQINALIPNAKENNPYFLFVSSFFWSKEMKSSASSGTMQIVNKTEFSKINFKVPCMREQIKIGELIRNLDRQIKSQEDKLEKLKQMKQAYLNEMFV